MDILIQIFAKEQLQGPKKQKGKDSDGWVTRIMIQTAHTQGKEDSILVDPGKATCHSLSFNGYTIDHKKFTNGLREIADRIDKEYEKPEKGGKPNDEDA